MIDNTIKVYEVDPDIDGNVVAESEIPVTVSPVVYVNGKFTIPNLDANGKAYYITFSSYVPVGLNETIVNTISDDLSSPNSDKASVPVNTIPTGGKVGAQLVDENGDPYIEWTITMNTQKIDVGSINVLDVFNSEYITFDINDETKYELYKDGNKETVSSSTLKLYTHNDDRTGFELNISDAGPHTYKFVYRTYYTTLGMQQPDIANNAEIVFRKSNGGTGGTDPDDQIGSVTKFPDVILQGPKAGIEKTGKYVTNQNKTEQEIEWTVVFNKSEILLEEPKISDIFTSGNYDYIDGSIVVSAGGEPFSNYTLTESNSISYKEGEVDKTGKGFILGINENTNKIFTITYRTTVDDLSGSNDENGNPIGNRDHLNKAILEWQGGKEEANAIVEKRDPGISKSGTVVINQDGTKSVNWTIDFNTSENIIKNFELKDTYTPTSVTVSDIKITTGGADVTSQFIISTETTGGIFTVRKAHLDAVPYQLTYSTTLSAAEEKGTIKNTAAITYTGGSDSAEKTITSPTLGVSKQATDLNKTGGKPVISWQINANTDNANKYVNLVDPVLTDTIPADQALIQNSIVVKKLDGTDVTNQSTISRDANSFTINLPNGPYEYVVTFDTEILEYPSVNEKLDRYTNSTTLSASTYDSVTDSAYQDYFEGADAGLVGKIGSQNPDTENVDWTVSVNPEGLTIKNPKISDTLSNQQTYLKDTVKIMNSKNEELENNSYILSFGEDNRSFTITFTAGVITEKINISYSTRLNPDLVGSYTVTNHIYLYGGTDQREIYNKSEPATAQQWFYGGGGTGRTLTFDLNKVNPQETKIPGAEFKIVRINTSGNKVDASKQTIKTDENGKFQFLDIRAGQYEVTEVSTPQGYVLLGDPIYLIAGYTNPKNFEYDDGDVENNPLNPYTLTITDSSWTPITSTVASTEGNVLAIVNQHKSVNFALEAEKTLNGFKKLNEGLFTFDLYKQLSEGTDPAFDLIQTKTNAAPAEGEDTGKIVFDAISYDLPGEYKYQIREKSQNINGNQYGDSETSHGITFDASVIYVTVAVTSDAYGNLTATASYGNEAPKFENSYLANPVEATIQASKDLINKDLQAGQFHFELKGHLDAATGKDVIVSNDADGKISFTINYTAAGTYTYTLRELIPDSENREENTDYDDSVYEVEVVVIDNGEGQLVVDSISYGGEKEQPVFTNTYYASVVLKAKKILQGRRLREGEFKFSLTPWNVATGNSINALNGTSAVSVVANDAEGLVSFPKITFDKAGDYYYIIEELPGNVGGVVYDKNAIIVKVGVAYNDASGQLEATIKGYHRTVLGENGLPDEALSDNDFIPTGDELPTFTNRYTAAPNVAIIEARKVLAGKDLAADQFSFELLDGNGKLIETVKNKTDGHINFAEITYYSAGEYNYTIREVKGSAAGITYDETEHKVTVMVTDDGRGQLHAEVIYKDNKTPTFTNTYKAAATSATVTAHKTLTGKTLTANQFSFELVDKDGKVLETVKNKADGSISFTALNFDTAGENSYTIREVKGSESGIIYDKTVHKVTVKVTDDKAGKLQAEVVYAQGKAPTFTNRFSTEDTGSQIPTEPDDGSEPDLPHTGEGRSTSALGLALTLAGLALGLFAWLQQR
ncbi:MAG: hypothetical protein GX777_09205, partial [Fastidiosipila sp.]|nr:hypothetical protein [Fastidiosipila sp.]